MPRSIGKKEASRPGLGGRKGTPGRRHSKCKGPEVRKGWI